MELIVSLPLWNGYIFVTRLFFQWQHYGGHSLILPIFVLPLPHDLSDTKQNGNFPVQKSQNWRLLEDLDVTWPPGPVKCLAPCATPKNEAGADTARLCCARHRAEKMTLPQERVLRKSYPIFPFFFFRRRSANRTSSCRFTQLFR